MKKTAAGLLAVVISVALPAALPAQICAGFPTSDRGLSFGARADFPEGLDSWGVDASYNASGPLSVFGGMNVVSVEDLDDSDFNIFNVGVAFETPAIGLMIGPRVSACPQVEFVFSDEDGSGWAVPIGLGVGGTTGTPGVQIMPYVVPQLVIVNQENLLDEDETSVDFGFKGGAMLGMGTFFIGGEVRHTFEDGADPVFGIRAGIRL